MYAVTVKPMRSLINTVSLSTILRAVVCLPENITTTSRPVQTPTPTTPRKITRSGREIRLPERFKIRDSELYYVYSGAKFIYDLEGRCDVIL